ncbi:hypothetical protein NXY56_008194 [Leishmania guyanensis]|uniref:J domain-containing protein n=1 Tax=Leishmania guyanensis TaxID=5670 RepID=A0A1E1J8B1_LEIGU|nr:hypothetical protein, conserved [Leishmania guyanensis]
MDVDRPVHKPNWRLYYLLDLIPPTTSRQVKWNFRKVTLRHHYYQAYLVLYNRSRKYLYDSIGEDAYGFISSGTWGPLVPVLGAVGTVVVYSLVLLVEVALLIFFFVFLAVKDDNYISWNWEFILLPLMIFVTIMIAVSVVALAVNVITSRTYEEGMSKIDRLSPVGNLFAAVCYFCIPFVFFTQIRNGAQLSRGFYLQYMSMPILGDIFYYATSLIWRWPRRVRLQAEVDNIRPSSVIYYGIFSMAFLNMACGVAQWVLIGLKLDGRLNHSWYIIFIPFCVRAGLRVAEAYLRSLMKYTIGVRMDTGVAFDTVGSFFSNGILLISLYFVAVRLERGREKVRLLHALIPVYSTLAWIFLCLIVTMIMELILYRHHSREERRINSQWTPPQDKDDEATKTLGGTDTSDSAPVRFFKTMQRNWDDVDVATASLTTYPPGLDNHSDSEEYEDFVTDEEEPVFTEAVEQRLQAPSDRHRSDDGEVAYRGKTPISNQDDSSGYGASRRTTSTAQRARDAPQRAAHSASDRDARGASSRRPTPRRQTPDVYSGMPASAISGEEDYTEVTTYMDERTAGSDTYEDATYSNSYTYTDQTTYFDQGADYTSENEVESHTRSSSYSSVSSSFSSVTSYTSKNAVTRR